MVAIVNWNNQTRRNNKRRIYPTVVHVNLPKPAVVKVNKPNNTRGRKYTRNNIKRINGSTYGTVAIIKNAPSPIHRATISKSPSPSRAVNAPKINISGSKVVLNTPNYYTHAKPHTAELITIKGKPTLKRNRGTRRLTGNNQNARLNNIIGVIN